MTESDDERKARLWREERRADEKRRKKLEGKDESSSIKRTLSSVSNRISEDARPYREGVHRITRPLHELSDEIKVRKQARAVGRFQKHELALEHADDLRERAEIKRYGRTLSADEKMRMQTFEDYEDRKKRERKERIKARAESFVRNVESVANADLSGFGASVGRESLPIAEPNYDTLLYGASGKPAPAKKSKVPARDPLLEMYSMSPPRSVNNSNASVLDDGLTRQKPVRYPKLSDEIGSLDHLFVGSTGKKKKGKQTNLFGNLL